MKRARVGGWWVFDEDLRVVFDDGKRVVVHNQDANVMFDGTRWLFDQCWKRGYFCD